MNIDRLFTVEGTDPYSLFEYEPFDCVLTHHETKETLLEMRGVEVPKHWSINARNILISKYFRKSGVPSAAVPTDITSSCPVPYWLRPC
jgi:ribonucleoside-diphosphate reductase alpha chain